MFCDDGREESLLALNTLLHTPVKFIMGNNINALVWANEAIYGFIIALIYDKCNDDKIGLIREIFHTDHPV